MFTTDPAHLHSCKRHVIERGADYLLDCCRLVGSHTSTCAQQMLAQRGPQALRVMLGLLQLAEKEVAHRGVRLFRWEDLGEAAFLFIGANARATKPQRIFDMSS